MARSSWSYQQPQPDSGYFSPHSGDMASLQFHFDESLQDHQETSAFSYGSMEEPIDKQLQFEPSMTSTPALDIQQGQLFRRRQHRSDPQLFPSRPPTCQKAQYHSHGHLCQPQVIWVGSATRATRSAATQTADSFRCANCQPNNSVDITANRPVAVVFPNSAPRRRGIANVPMEQIDPADMPSITAVATHLAQIGDELEAGHVATDDAGLMSTIQAVVGTIRSWIAW